MANEPTHIPCLEHEIIVDFDIWRSFIPNDLLSNTDLRSSTYVLITDHNLYVRPIDSLST